MEPIKTAAANSSVVKSELLMDYRPLRPQMTMAIEKVKTANNPAQPSDKISIVLMTRLQYTTIVTGYHNRTTAPREIKAYDRTS
jgi:hypothetical protein